MLKYILGGAIVLACAFSLYTLSKSNTQIKDSKEYTLDSLTAAYNGTLDSLVSKSSLDSLEIYSLKNNLEVILSRPSKVIRIPQIKWDSILIQDTSLLDSIHFIIDELNAAENEIEYLDSVNYMLIQLSQLPHVATYVGPYERLGVVDSTFTYQIDNPIHLQFTRKNRLFSKKDKYNVWVNTPNGTITADTLTSIPNGLDVRFNLRSPKQD